jgi:hypothetical protein
MIVLVETSTGMKKAFIRDKIFMEVDAGNKKIPNGTIRTANIKNIIWLAKGKAAKVPTDAWLKLADEKDFFNID